MSDKKILEKNGFFYTEPTQLKTISNHTMEMGSYKHVEVKDKVILDIGACVGSFAKLSFEGGCKKYIAFEPDPDNFKVLELNNKNKDSVLIQGAISNSNEEYITFYEAESGNKTIGYTDSEYTKDLNKNNRKEFKVKNYNFNEILDKYKPDVIKCDIEGGEFELFDKYLPNYVTEVVMEIHVMNKSEKILKMWYDIFGKTFLGYRWKCVKQPNYSSRTIQCYNGLNVFTIGFKRESNWLELEKKSRYGSLNSSLKRKFGKEYSVDDIKVFVEIQKYCNAKTEESRKSNGKIQYTPEGFIEYKNKL